MAFPTYWTNSREAKDHQGTNLYEMMGALPIWGYCLLAMVQPIRSTSSNFKQTKNRHFFYRICLSHAWY